MLNTVDMVLSLPFVAASFFFLLLLVCFLSMLLFVVFLLVQSEEAAKQTFDLESKHEAALSSGEERLREVLGSLHAVEKAFVQHKDRYKPIRQSGSMWPAWVTFGATWDRYTRGATLGVTWTMLGVGSRGPR